MKNDGKYILGANRPNYQIISQNYLVDSELERVIQRDIKQLMSIGCYYGFHHNVGLPLRGSNFHM